MSPRAWVRARHRVARAKLVIQHRAHDHRRHGDRFARARVRKQPDDDCDRQHGHRRTARAVETHRPSARAYTEVAATQGTQRGRRATTTCSTAQRAAETRRSPTTEIPAYTSIEIHGVQIAHAPSASARGSEPLWAATRNARGVPRMSAAIAPNPATTVPAITRFRPMPPARRAASAAIGASASRVRSAP